MRYRILSSVAAAAILAWASAAGAATPEVRDEAGFFKPETITAANKIISDVKRDDKKDLVVETFLNVPKGKEQEAEDRGTKATFFKDWAVQRVHEEGVNGVYVLICKNPSYIRVAVSGGCARAFSEWDQELIWTNC